MTAALTCNGITIPLVKGSLEEVPEFPGEQAERGAAGDFDENLVTIKRGWTATVLPQTPAKALAMRSLLEGRGQSFTYDANTFSAKGEGPSAGGTYTQAGAGGFVGGKVNVGSGSFIPYSLGNSLFGVVNWRGAKGWTLVARKVLTVGDGGDGVTYQRHIATGAVTVVQAAAANPAGVTQYKNGAAGSFAMGNWITVDGAGDGVVKLHGVSNAAANAAYDYDDFVFWPFVFDPTWVAGYDAYLTTNQHSPLKRVHLSGLHVEDAAPGVLVHVRAKSIPRAVRLGDPSWRSLKLQIWEA